MIALQPRLVCPIVVSKRLKHNWEICNDLAEFLVQGTLLCREHALHSDVQKSFLSVCGIEGADHHVIRQGSPWCLCDNRIMAFVGE
jgi:hypothetical protein